MECLFCSMVKGEIPCHKIWEDENHLAILSIFPNTLGFTVVFPKKHCTSYAFEQDDATLCDLTLATKRVARILDTAFEDVGRCGMFFEGFGVDHLHSKLFPMHGTSDMRSWKPIESKLNTFYEVYPGYLSSHDAPQASESELADLAKMIRRVAQKS